MKRLHYFFYFILIVCTLLVPSLAQAHEAYVIPYNTFWDGLKAPWSGHAFDALKNAQDDKVAAIIVISVFIALGIAIVVLRKWGTKIDAFFERYAKYGPHFVRIAIGIAFIFSALGGGFLGPELKVSLFPYASIVQASLFIIGVMILVGFLTELAAAIGIILFVSSFFIFGPYVLTYLNYFGELLVLVLFGLRMFSLDRKLFGPLKRFPVFEKYGTVIVRVFYGLALIYAAITVKLLHPDLTIGVVNTWNLTKFHWLFPSDPVLITLGAGIVESVIGLFIIFGFQMRLTVIISLFYITLSLFYFRELVWPHLMLYGISFNLLVQPEVASIDRLFVRSKKNIQKT